MSRVITFACSPTPFLQLCSSIQDLNVIVSGFCVKVIRVETDSIIPIQCCRNRRPPLTITLKYEHVHIVLPNMMGAILPVRYQFGLLLTLLL